MSRTDSGVGETKERERLRQRVGPRERISLHNATRILGVRATLLAAVSRTFFEGGVRIPIPGVLRVRPVGLIGQGDVRVEGGGLESGTPTPAMFLNREQ